VRVLFAAAELSPLAQTGGLGEAVSGLARALSERGHELRCALPAYRSALAHPACPPLEDANEIELGTPIGLVRGRYRRGSIEPRLEAWLFDQPDLYDRPGIYGEGGYGYWDEGWRYAAFARGVAALCAADPPDVLVAHDWHAALAIGLLRTRHWHGVGRKIGLVQVIHNNRFQGRYPRDLLAWTDMPPEHFHPDGFEFYGDVSLLKAGVMWADRIVAVSPTYARELTRPELGDGLDGVYRSRADRSTGIVNGIDVERYDPAADPCLPFGFEAARPEGKSRCRSALLQELALEPCERGRFLAAIGRLTPQKGWDVLVPAIDALVARGASLVLLGDGEPWIAGPLAEAAARHPGRVHFRQGWDDALARRTYAGADAVLVPSRFEPCGLVQLIAQRYGSIPVAHRTGGLADTIVDGESGILFDELSPTAIVEACDRAAVLAGRRGIVRSLLSIDVSWRRSVGPWEQVLEESRHQASTLT
jgi:starch synthase